MLYHHKTTKSPKSPTYSPQWSGVTGAPHCRAKGGGPVPCPDCGESLHHEGDGGHYCPRCDDYKGASDCDKN